MNIYSIFFPSLTCLRLPYNSMSAELFGENIQLELHIPSLLWNDTDVCNTSLWKTMTGSSYIVNTLATDEITTSDKAINRHLST